MSALRSVLAELSVPVSRQVRVPPVRQLLSVWQFFTSPPSHPALHKTNPLQKYSFLSIFKAEAALRQQPVRVAHSPGITIVLKQSKPGGCSVMQSGQKRSSAPLMNNVSDPCIFQKFMNQTNTPPYACKAPRKNFLNFKIQRFKKESKSFATRDTNPIVPSAVELQHCGCNLVQRHVSVHLGAVGKYFTVFHRVTAKNYAQLWKAIFAQWKKRGGGKSSGQMGLQKLFQKPLIPFSHFGKRKDFAPCEIRTTRAQLPTQKTPPDAWTTKPRT